MGHIEIRPLSSGEYRGLPGSVKIGIAIEQVLAESRLSRQKKAGETPESVVTKSRGNSSVPTRLAKFGTYAALIAGLLIISIGQTRPVRADNHEPAEPPVPEQTSEEPSLPGNTIALDSSQECAPVGSIYDARNPGNWLCQPPAGLAPTPEDPVVYHNIGCVYGDDRSSLNGFTSAGIGGGLIPEGIRSIGIAYRFLRDRSYPEPYDVLQVIKAEFDERNPAGGRRWRDVIGAKRDGKWAPPLRLTRPDGLDSMLMQPLNDEPISPGIYVYVIRRREIVETEDGEKKEEFRLVSDMISCQVGRPPYLNVKPNFPKGLPLHMVQ